MKKISVCFLAVLTLLTGCSVNIDWEDEKTTDEVVAPTIKGQKDIETPAVKEPATITEKLNTIDDYVADTTLIDKYYALIEEGKLDEAYALKTVKNTSLATFKGWYTNTKTVDIRDMEDLGEHKYRFIVDLVNDDESEESYKVTMEVADGKLITSSSVTLPAKELRLGEKNGYEYLYLSVKGKEELIVKHYTNPKNTYETHIRNYKLFEDNKYVAYDIQGLGMDMTYIYNIGAKKSVVSMASPKMYGFTDDEKFFYACQQSGLYGGYVSIYKVTSNSVNFYKDLSAGSAVSNCYGYNKDMGYFEYEVEYSYDPLNEIRRYYYFGEDVVR